MPAEETSEHLSRPAPGGWLLFFVITSYLGCVSLALQIMRPASLGRTLLLIFVFVTTFSNAILAGAASDLTFVSLWVQFITRLILTAANLHILWAVRSDQSADLAHGLINQAGSVFIGAFWLVYFRRSQRVRETFGRNL
jgi:membrane protein implicated in regulation of membrane protease activity